MSKKVLVLALSVVLLVSMAAGSVFAAKKNIHVIVKGLGNSYWAVLLAGATEAGRDFNANVIIQGISDGEDINNQVEMLRNAVSAQADAIVIAVADSQAQANAVSEVFKSGIPIVMVDTKAATDDYSAALLTNNVAAGEMAAAELIRQIKKLIAETDSAEIAIQIGSVASQTQVQRVEGFQAYWNANAPASWILLTNDIKVNNGDIERAIRFGYDFLTAYPNIKGFFSPNNGSTVGFATVLRDSNRTDIAMVGFDFSPEIEQIIRDKRFSVSTMLQLQYLMGFEGVRLALDLANGGTVTEKDIDTGVLAVYRENVDNVGYLQTLRKIK